MGWQRRSGYNRRSLVETAMYRIAPAVACQPVEASTDPDGCWHAEACHPIQHIASNLCLDLLTGQSPGEASARLSVIATARRCLAHAAAP